MLGLPISAILAAIYAYIVVYCPVVGYVNVLFLAGYVYGPAVSISWLASLGKCRNGKILFVLGCLAGLVGLYFSWLFSLKALAGERLPMADLLGLIISPGAFWELIVDINREGWWGPSGIFQWALCAIEAIAFVFGVGLVAAGSIDREVFCEDCGKWCNQTHTRHLKFTEEYANTFEQNGGEDFNHLGILKLQSHCGRTASVPRYWIAHSARTLPCD